MDKKKTRKIILIGSAIVILGVAGYFGYKWWKDRQQKKDEKPPDDSSGGSTDFGSGGGGSTTTITSNPFKTSDELKKFQQWVIDIKKDSAILGSKGADGLWGKNSANAWDKYGSDYQKETGAIVTTTTGGKSTLLRISGLKNIKTFGGTPNSPKDEKYYNAGETIGYVAFKKPNGQLTIEKTSEYQTPIVEKGQGALLSNMYYFQYYDTNTKTFRNIQLQQYQIDEGLSKSLKFTAVKI